MTRRLTVGLFCALLIQSTLIVSAEARPRYRAAEPVQTNCFIFCEQAQPQQTVRRQRSQPDYRSARRLVPRERDYSRQPVVKVTSDSSLLGQTSDSVVATAKQYIGAGAVFGRRSLWCARFMNHVLAKAGHRGTGSDVAKSFAAMPETSPRVGAIAVLGRKGGGHVGVVSGFDKSGNPIIISGNHGGRVAESVYSRSRVIKFVSPS